MLKVNIFFCQIFDPFWVKLTPFRGQTDQKSPKLTNIGDFGGEFVAKFRDLSKCDTILELAILFKLIK